MQSKTHIIKGSTTKTLCGRTHGTPGGKIYPGVHAIHRHWESAEGLIAAGRICKQCLK